MAGLLDKLLKKQLKVLICADERDRALWGSVADDFEHEYKHVQINYVWCADPVELTNRFERGEKSDLVLLPNGALGWFAVNGWISPVTERIARLPDEDDSLMPSAFWRYGSDVYGLNSFLEPLLVYYNKDLFENAGLPFPASDWTWDDFARSAVQLSHDKNGQKTFGFADDELCRLFLAHLWSNGGTCFDSEEMPLRCTIHEEMGVHSAAFIRSLITEGAMPRPGQAPGGFRDMFAGGEAAMLLDGSWLIPKLEGSGIHYGVAPLPLGNVRRGGWCSRDSSWCATVAVPVSASGDLVPPEPEFRFLPRKAAGNPLRFFQALEKTSLNFPMFGKMRWEGAL